MWRCACAHIISKMCRSTGRDMLKEHMEHSRNEHMNQGRQAHMASMVLENIPQDGLSFHSLLHIQKDAPVGYQSVLLGFS